MQTTAEFYIKRNVQLLKQWIKLTRVEGMKTRMASKTVAENNDGITEGLVNGIVYNKKYPYAAEAWAIIHKEEEEAEEEKREAEPAAG